MTPLRDLPLRRADVGEVADGRAGLPWLDDPADGHGRGDLVERQDARREAVSLYDDLSIPDPDGFAARLRAEPALVPALAQILAGALAQQHTRIVEADVAGWLPTVPAWPPPAAEMQGQLPRVVGDANLRRRIGRLLAVGHDLGTQLQDRVLVHSDLGLHNVAFDPATGVVNGVFDYGDAAWANRHLDFRYLVFAPVPDALLDAAMAVYRDATGVALDRRRILICDAMASVGHLADRVGHGPQEVFAGRTLAGDLRWTDRSGF